ncbi:PAS domain S-box protein [Candidatus Bathyarchaeota archaeon]|nr:PAS domain S-box protein [Candidatus Bathyarchaeota archaeon]
MTSQDAVTIRVLHVDDDPSLLEVSKLMMLDIDGSFEIEHVCCVDEGLCKLAAGHYDVVVSDYEMPQKDGLQFLKELREQNNEVPFILFTGKGREDVAVMALNLGADGYFNKQGGPETVYGELAHGIRQAYEKAKAKSALRDSEEKFRVIFEGANDGILVADMETKRFVFANPKMSELTGYSLDELAKLGVDEFHLKKDLPYVHAEFEKQLKREKPYSVDIPILKKDGQIIYCDVNSEPIIIGNRKVMTGFFRDTTERKRAEEEIRSLAKFPSENPNPVLRIAKDGAVLYANPVAMSQLSELMVEVGQPAPPKLGRLVADAFSSGLKKQFEVEHGDRIFLLTLAPVAEAAYVNVYGFDITERKKAEEILRKSEENAKEVSKKLTLATEKLNIFSRLTRHGIRNKLAIIQSNTYLLRKHTGDKPEISKYLAEIDSAVAIANKLFDACKVFEKMGAEEPRKMNVEECFNTAASLQNVDDIAIVNQTQGLVVIADSLLRLLFYNLIENSLRHGEKVTQIQLYYTKEGDGLKLFYEDNGVGIPDANKPKLFTEGFNTGKSTGLGLFLIKKIVEAYGWSITEEGEPGKGAKFTIAIPKLNNSGKENFQIKP